MSIYTKSELAELKTLSEDMRKVMFKRANVSKQTICDVAIRNWISQNLDLLTPAERIKYKKVIL